MYRIERVVKIKREIEDMDRFEEEEMKNIRPIKNTWFDLLINKFKCFKRYIYRFF